MAASFVCATGTSTGLGRRRASSRRSHCAMPLSSALRDGGRPPFQKNNQKPQQIAAQKMQKNNTINHFYFRLYPCFINLDYYLVTI